MIGLKIKLWRLKKASAPRSEFSVALRERIVGESVHVVVQGSSFMFRYALTPVVIVLLAGFGTTTYAYASPSVAEGHVLYPLKSSVEVVEEQMYRTPEARATYRIIILHRRTDEMGYKIDHGRALPPPAFFDQMNHQFDLTEGQLRKNTVQMAEKEKARQEQETQALEALQSFRLKVEVADMDEDRRANILREIDVRIERLQSL